MPLAVSHRRTPLGLAVAAAWLATAFAAAAAIAHPLVANVNTDRAAYAPGAPVTLWVDLLNGTGATFGGSVQVAITHLGAPVTTFAPQSVTALAAGGTATRTFTWTAPAGDFQGYLVAVSVLDAAGARADSFSCAVDVSSDWTRFPRYGYLASYNTDSPTAWHEVWQLKNLHLNALQFYDWQWKHHVPYNTGASWPDIANRTVLRSTVNDFIAAAHAYGMLAFNYNLYGAAYDGYGQDGSGVDGGMALYDAAHNQLSFTLPSGWATPRLWQMNNRDARWQPYIFGREATVFANFAFDGWHIDCLGTHAAYDWGGNAFNLDDYNAPFVNNAKAALGKRMLINNVDAVGLQPVAAGANVDVLYAELWDGHANYADIASLVTQARAWSAKPLVLPAYMNRNLSSGTFNEASVRLADAAIFASGASHLELGDGDKMLHVEYFPNDLSVTMSASLQEALRGYYDFLVGYENLLRDGQSPAAARLVLAGADTSTDARAGTVWVIARRDSLRQVVHLVNLLANTSTRWRDDNGTYATPPTLTNVAAKLYYEGTIGDCALHVASPDVDGGQAATLATTKGSDAAGQYLAFTLPRLAYWDMLWLDTCPHTGGVAPVTPPAGRLELSSPYPNPSATETRFDLRLAVGGMLRADVFDLAGHRVAALVPGVWQAPGARALVWDHRDAAGRPVAPGIYEVRVDAGAASAVRRVTVRR